jgi:hypothetical protein
VQGHAVLLVMPGSPLMLAENINMVISPFPGRLTVLGLVNGTIVEFHGFYGTDDDDDADL